MIAETKLISYFVRYEFFAEQGPREGELRTRNIGIELSKPVRSMEDINTVQLIIARKISTPQESYSVRVMSWQRFEKDE